MSPLQVQRPSTELVGWGTTLVGVWVSLGGAVVVFGAPSSSLVLLGLPVLAGGIFLVLLGSGILPLQILYVSSSALRDTVGRVLLVGFGVFSLAAGPVRFLLVDRLHPRWERIAWDIVLVLNGIAMIRGVRDIKRRAEVVRPQP